MVVIRIRKLGLVLIIMFLIIGLLSPMIVGDGVEIKEPKKIDHRFFSKLPVHLKPLFADMLKRLDVGGGKHI